MKTLVTDGSSKTLDETDRRIIDALQTGFPLCERPFLACAQKLEIPEMWLIERLQRLLAAGVLSRFGPMYNAERLGGVYVLAAMAVPEEEYEQVADCVNALPEIAHNYRREHALNMWFVAAAETPGKVEAAFRCIERRTGLPVYRFPKEREYYLGMRLQA